MNENRLPDYLEHMQKAASDACSFIDAAEGIWPGKLSGVVEVQKNGGWQGTICQPEHKLSLCVD
jgi:hypothetical protein